MQVKHLLIFLFILCCPYAYSQNNVDIYRIERAGDTYLQKAEFSTALDTYRRYKILSNGQMLQGIEKKINNLVSYIEIYNDGERLYRNGRYIQAVEKFKQYRELFPGIAIKSIDGKIEDALIKIEKSKALAGLNEKDKIIFGFEKNYLAEKDLSAGRLEQAKQGYSDAMKSVQGVKQKNSVAVQARERIAQIEKAANIQKSLEGMDGPRRKVALLESYRSPGAVVISTFEEQINSYNIQLDQSIKQPNEVVDLESELRKVAGNCDMNLLLTYVKNSPASKYSTVSKDTLVGNLIAIQEDLNEIRTLSLTGDNSQRNQYVFGGYVSIIEKSENVAIVGPMLKSCFKREYFELLFKTAKPLFDKETNIPLSREMAITAKEFAESADEKRKVDGLLLKINQRIGCATIIKTTNATLDVVETNLRSCLVTVAKNNLEIAVRSSQGCSTTTLESRITRLSSELNALESRMRRASVIKTEVNNRLRDGMCDGVIPLLGELRNIETCDKGENSAFVETKSKEVTECNRSNEVNRLMVSSRRMLNDIDPRSADTEKSRSGLERVELEIDKAEAMAIESEKQSLRELKSKVTSARSTVATVEANQRRRARREFTRILKPEFYAGVACLVPGIESARETIRTTTTFTGNYEAGISLRSLKRGALINYAVSAGYETNNFQIAADGQRDVEDLKVDYATSALKLTTGFRNNGHLYFGVGFGVKHPIKTRYEYKSDNLIIESDYFAKNDYAYTQLFSSLHLGYEWHIKNLGFSLEAFTKLSGMLENEDTQKTTFPVLKTQSFQFSKSNQEYYKTSALVFGVVASFHLW